MPCSVARQTATLRSFVYVSPRAGEPLDPRDVGVPPGVRVTLGAEEPVEPVLARRGATRACSRPRPVHRVEVRAERDALLFLVAQNLSDGHLRYV